MRLLLRSTLRPAAVTLTALATAACFSDAPPVVAPPPVLPTTATVEASSTANTFSPATVTIAKGGSVTWNIGTRRHNVTFFANPAAPLNIESATSVTQSRTFTAAGTYPYNCSLHAGMTGTVIVQ